MPPIRRPETSKPRTPETRSPLKKAKERITKTQLLMAKGLSLAFEFAKKGIYQVAPWTKRIFGGLGLGVLGALWQGLIPFVNQFSETFFSTKNTGKTPKSKIPSRKTVSVSG